MTGFDPSLREALMPDASDTAVSEVLGRIPSGCSILTASHEGRSTGILASWIQQASFNPLLLTVAVRDGRPIQALIDASGRFVLNLLGGDGRAMLEHFARGFAPDDAAFEGLAHRDSAYGVILDDVLGYLECEVKAKSATGDHWLYVGHPLSAGIGRPGEPYVHVRKSATNY